MSAYLSAFFQCFFIPTPTLTESNLPSQAGRVFIVTGGYAGCGKELSSILYSANGTVYIAGRSAEKGSKAIEEIKARHPNSDGKIEFLKVDLADLATIAPAVKKFSQLEQRLDVLTNNAGVMIPPKGSKTEQGLELQWGTNVVGPWLFSELLTPLLKKTAASSPKGSVRVTWAASLATLGSPSTGVAFDGSGEPKVHGNPSVDYSQSKASNVLLAQAYAEKHGNEAGIVSNSWNPGNLNSELARHTPSIGSFFIRLICYPPVYGAYTELFAGWSDEAGKDEHQAKYIVPWGRFADCRGDLKDSVNRQKLWDWCEKYTKPYAA